VCAGRGERCLLGGRTFVVGGERLVGVAQLERALGEEGPALGVALGVEVGGEQGELQLLLGAAQLLVERAQDVVRLRVAWTCNLPRSTCDGGETDRSHVGG